MKCPNDATDLVMAERQGIEIDYCPNCRGVWLDRGELDKLIERSAGAPAPRPEAQYGQPSRPGASHREAHYPRRRKSLLGELFDF